ncbi:hypothetical protein SAMN06264849_11925 [Melghirimyces algeriensis]|uniref:Uncharacterized protein n=1 Tax=Melghirimyces algeriensis TaxID=910412 RepID=A0A521FHX5_9BACL|nr:hypothetical protein SAMN06264849_11925 [Melghirimyces algeriensis]
MRQVKKLLYSKDGSSTIEYALMVLAGSLLAFY